MTTAEDLSGSCSVHRERRDERCEACLYAARAKALAKVIDVYGAMVKKQNEAVILLIEGKRQDALARLVQFSKMTDLLKQSLDEVMQLVS